MAYIEVTHRFDTLGGQSRFWAVLPETGLLGNIPVVMLLHGAGDDGSGWLRFTGAERYAAEKGIALIIPGVGNSYYADMVYGARYFSFVTRELPAECRRMFGLSARRENSYVVGLSMGGYGALKCALTNPEQYTACAAFSSAVRPEKLLQSEAWPLPPAAGTAIFGGEVADGQVPAACDLFALAKKARKNGTRLPDFYLACGEQDPLFAVNCELHSFFDENKIQHTFCRGPGTHQWEYWDRQLKSVLDIFF